jgi:hypothetical protein
MDKYLIWTLQVLGRTSFTESKGFLFNVSFVNLHGNYELLFSPSTSIVTSPKE